MQGQFLYYCRENNNIMVNLSRIIFKTTGMMSNKEVVKTSRKIGVLLAEETKNGSRFTTKRIGELLTDSIGKKRANKIVISDTYEDLERYMRALGVTDEVMMKDYYRGTASSVLTNPKDKSVLLSLRVKDYRPEEALNLASHELEHALSQSITPEVKFEYLYAKLRGKNYLENYIAKYGEVINQKNIELQDFLLSFSKLDRTISGSAVGATTAYPLNIQGLVSHLELSNKKALDEILNNKLKELLDQDNSTNEKILSSLSSILKEESRAYRVGGAVERHWKEINGIHDSNANNSEMMALLYDETLKQVKKEYNALFINRLKSFFRFNNK